MTTRREAIIKEFVLRKYGTPEGVKLAWDKRGRGRKAYVPHPRDAGTPKTSSLDRQKSLTTEAQKRGLIPPPEKKTPAKPKLALKGITIAQGEIYTRYSSKFEVKKISNDSVTYSYQAFDGKIKENTLPINEFKKWAEGFTSKYSEDPIIAHTLSLVKNEQEAFAFRKYTAGDYVAINKKLIGYDITSEDIPTTRRNDFNFDESLKQMDDVMSKASFPEEKIVYSGLGEKATKFLDEVCPPKICGEGNEFELKGFTSTSLSKDTTKTFRHDKNTLLEIKIMKGCKALSLEPISAFPTEKEVLLNRGSSFKVIGSRMEGMHAGRHRILTVEMMK